MGPGDEGCYKVKQPNTSPHVSRPAPDNCTVYVLNLQSTVNAKCERAPLKHEIVTPPLPLSLSTNWKQPFNCRSKLAKCSTQADKPGRKRRKISSFSEGWTWYEITGTRAWWRWVMALTIITFDETLRNYLTRVNSIIEIDSETVQWL